MAKIRVRVEEQQPIHVTVEEQPPALVKLGEIQFIEILPDPISYDEYKASAPHEDKYYFIEG